MSKGCPASGPTARSDRWHQARCTRDAGRPVKSTSVRRRPRRRRRGDEVDMNIRVSPGGAVASGRGGPSGDAHGDQHRQCRHDPRHSGRAGLLTPRRRRFTGGYVRAPRAGREPSASDRPGSSPGIASRSIERRRGDRDQLSQGRGSVAMIADITADGDSPRNARLPVTNSYSTHPSAKMSVRESASRPSICSGAMYAACRRSCARRSAR